MPAWGDETKPQKIAPEKIFYQNGKFLRSLRNA
jgi:hypothetical protein